MTRRDLTHVVQRVKFAAGKLVCECGDVLRVEPDADPILRDRELSLRYQEHRKAEGLARTNVADTIGQRHKPPGAW